MHQQQELSDHDLLVGLHTEMKSVSTFIENADKKYVSKDQFWPVKTIVYAATAIILCSVFTGLVYTVVKTNQSTLHAESVLTIVK